MVPFAGYCLPVQYGTGVLKEHLHCRADGKAALFDVSHMGQLFWRGKDCLKFLESLTVADLHALRDGNAQLSVILNERGGIMDDTIITRVSSNTIFEVVNGATKYGDLKFIEPYLNAARKKGWDVSLEHMESRQLLALQGPGAAEVVRPLVTADLSKMRFMTSAEMEVGGVPCRVSRLGYTGEDGFEIGMAWQDATKVMDMLLENKNVMPAGLGCRDSLRLESGLCLYGNDLNENITPVEGSLTWLIDERRRKEGGFPGAAVIQKQLKSGVSKKRVGFAIHGAPAREHTKIFTPDGKHEIGEVTSGTLSPCLKKAVSMGYVQTKFAKLKTPLAFKVRDKLQSGVVAKMPFVKQRYYKPV